MSAGSARDVLARQSKSFALAARLLPRRCRNDVAVLYAYCRRADDAVDEAPSPGRPARVEALFAELASVYAGVPQSDSLLVEFQRVVRAHGIPEAYPRALLEGMRTDLGPVRIADERELSLYAHRVAGAVGLMLCHVFGLRDPRALVNADHLGIAMQLTNICRDVEEDFHRDRLYLPADLLKASGVSALRPPHGALAPARNGLARATQALLALADRYYASGDAGLSALPFRVALAVRAARLVYSAIGRELARRGYDVLAGRAVVPLWRKLVLVGLALALEVAARVRARLAGPPPLDVEARDA
jgi:15-cis-phytoene synthase